MFLHHWWKQAVALWVLQWCFIITNTTGHAPCTPWSPQTLDPKGPIIKMHTHLADTLSSRTVVFNWWVADPFRVGRGCEWREKRLKKKNGPPVWWLTGHRTMGAIYPYPQFKVIHTDLLFTLHSMWSSKFSYQNKVKNKQWHKILLICGVVIHFFFFFSECTRMRSLC